MHRGERKPGGAQVGAAVLPFTGGGKGCLWWGERSCSPMFLILRDQHTLHIYRSFDIKHDAFTYAEARCFVELSSDKLHWKVSSVFVKKIIQMASFMIGLLYFPFRAPFVWRIKLKWGRENPTAGCSCWKQHCNHTDSYICSLQIGAS